MERKFRSSNERETTESAMLFDVLINDIKKGILRLVIYAVFAHTPRTLFSLFNEESVAFQRAVGTKCILSATSHIF